jgi:hypothetical protein
MFYVGEGPTLAALDRSRRRVVRTQKDSFFLLTERNFEPSPNDCDRLITAGLTFDPVRAAPYRRGSAVPRLLTCCKAAVPPSAILIHTRS